MLYSPLLSGLTWITHGFGTRQDDIAQDQMASVRQIHSGKVLCAREIGQVGEGDALITHSQIPVSIRTADCYPVLLADVRNHAVAAIHAGWRGTAAGIVQNTLNEMRREFGTLPKDVRAAIGPGIGICCYEVGAEVARQFGKTEAGCIDLAGINRRQLLDTGVDPQSIDVLGGCTRCDAAQFHSYRRDHAAAGRMISFIGLA